MEKEKRKQKIIVSITISLALTMCVVLVSNLWNLLIFRVGDISRLIGITGTICLLALAIYRILDHGE